MRFFDRSIAVDLGTANTLVYVRGRGVVLEEPSVVAVSVRDGRPVAIGSDAKRMLGRTPAHISAHRPLKDGVIADFELCQVMLAYFLRQTVPSRWIRPRVVVCVPSGITGVERRAVIDAAERAGARKGVQVVDEPLAAAIGAGLPVHEPTGTMIVDIGGGTTEVALLSLGGIVTATSIRIGGDKIDEAIATFVKKEHGLAIGTAVAEAVKLAIGTAYPPEEELAAEVPGRDLTTGLPRVAVVSSEEIREAIEEPVAAISDAVTRTLDMTPPDLAADILERGVVLCGGGALLAGLDVRLAEDTGLRVTVANDPLRCVVLGGGVLVESLGAAAPLLDD